ncbi:unnamed protein product, partial [Mesorhabditis spiculigera]
MSCSNGGMKELALRLRDGQMLCRLVNKVEEGAVPEKNIMAPSINSEFACEKNICAFFTACKDKFYLDSSEFFDPPDLFLCHDFAKVLTTLSALSHSKKMIEQGIDPFPPRINGYSPGRAQGVPVEEEEIYRSLGENVIYHPDMELRPVDSGYKTEDNHKIYDTIVQRRDSQKFEPEDVFSSFKPIDDRGNAIKELVDTEQNYLKKSLDNLVNKIMSPLQRILSEDDYKRIFMNLPEIWRNQHEFYKALRVVALQDLGLEKPSGSHIGDVFCEFQEKFVAYGHYSTYLDEATDRIQELKKDDAFTYSKITECVRSAGQNQFPLNELLVVPLQRILKYGLLLSRIRDNTRDMAEHSSLGAAMEAFKDLSECLNEMKRDYEMQRETMELQESIINLSMPGDTTLVDYGRMLQNQTVQLSEVTKENNNPTKTKTRHAFLFDKVLVICKSNGARAATYTYKTAYVVSDLRMDLETPLNDEKRGTFSKKLNTLFWLTLVRDGARLDKPDEVRTINISFKDRKQLDQWANAFEKAKNNIHPKEAITTGHNVKLTTLPPDRAHNCSVCRKLLKGLYLQGYNCSACDQIMHLECISLQKCPGPRRRRSAGMSIARKSSTGSISPGDHVIATCSSTEIGWAPYAKDDIIIVQELLSENSFIGTIQREGGHAGKVKIQDVRRINWGTPTDSPIGSGKPIRLGRKTTTLLPARADIPPQTPTDMNDYVNTDISQHQWYHGNMERPMAEKCLKGTPCGTFLVRFSPTRNSCVVSVSCDNDVKHMVIEHKNSNYYLDEGYMFDTIVQLVEYYNKNNLIESFATLNTTLKSPYNEQKLFKVIHDFESDDVTGKFLELHKGDIVYLLDTVGQDRGWWKGRIGNKSGFFPLTYVVKITDENDSS